MFRPLLLCTVLALAPMAQAQPLVLDFLPPDIEASDICVPAGPGPGTQSVGAETEAAVLTDADRIRFLRRDIRNYMAEDADRFFEFIDALIERQESLDDTFTPVDALFARIDLMLRAGRIDQLVSEGLVEVLHDRLDELTNGQKVALARFYADGTGVVADPALAQELIREAAYGGNASALLEIARLAQEGALVEGWDAPLDLTITMAFGGLLGPLDQGICTRASRIAQEYLKGDVVRANPALALAWFRFAANQGGAEAAWRVVEHHLNADADVQDNVELRDYLRRAVRLGIIVDEAAAAAIKATGAVTSAELETLLGFNHAQDGRRTRASIPAHLQLDVTRPPEEVPKDSPYHVYLRETAEMETAPGRVFDKIAQEVLLRKGRWAGEAEALALLEEATRRGDEDGQRRLANMLVRYRDDAVTIARVDTMLADAVARFGSARAMDDLDTLYRCQVNDAPRLDRAKPWAAAYAASGHAVPQISGADVLALSPDRDPETIALIQSRALDRRVQMMAAHAQRVQASAGAHSDAVRYWADLLNRSNQALEAFAEFEFELAASPTERDLAIELLRRVALHNGTTTALELGFALVEYHGRDPEVAALIEAQLTLAGNRGEGAAIRLLSRLQADTRSETEVFAQFAETIEARGDFLALMFAIPHISSVQLDDYVDRAVSLMNCGTKDAAELSDAYAIHGDAEMSHHWTQVGLRFEGGHVLSKLRLSNAQMAHYARGSSDEAVVRAARDVAEGDHTALLRLVQLTADPDLSSYDADAAIEHFLAAVQQNVEPGALVAIYRNAPQEVRSGLDKRIDFAAVLKRSAQSGDSAAAYELGMLSRVGAMTTTDLEQSVIWLERAAEQGHPDAMYETGYAYGFGLGVSVDPEVALDWLERADAIGHAEAASLSRLLRVRGGP